MKRHVFLKFMMLLLAVIISFNFASIPHSMKAVHHGKVVLEDDPNATASFHFEEQKDKHLDASGILQSNILVNLVLTTFFIVLLSLPNLRRMLKHFLYSVYYQSSYFSKYHFVNL